MSCRECISLKYTNVNQKGCWYILELDAQDVYLVLGCNKPQLEFLLIPHDNEKLTNQIITWNRTDGLFKYKHIY